MTFHGNRVTMAAALLMFFSLAGSSGICRAEAGTSEPDGLTRGWDFYRSKDFDFSVKEFEKVLADSGANTETGLQAIFGLATNFNLRRPGEDPAKAVKLYEQVLALAPRHDLAAWSLLALARMKHLVPVGEEPDFRAVRAAYQTVIDRFPGHPAAEEAFLFQQSTLVATLKLQDASRALEKLLAYIKAHPKSPYLSPLYGLAAHCYYTLGDVKHRLEFDIKSLSTREVDPTNPNMLLDTGPYWGLATEAEFVAGDFATARKYYHLFINGNPSDPRIFGAKLALKRMDKVEADLRAGRRVNTGREAKKEEP
jgi:tetratricopeptide (TPR) repeat protein